MARTMLFSFVALCVSSMCVLGQVRYPVGPRPAEDVAPEDMIRVRSFNGIGPRSTVKTPVFNTTAERGARAPQDWHLLLLQYEVLVPWIDDMTVQFVALGLMRDPETGANLYSLFRRNIRYVDLEGGRDRMRRADAFLRPAAMKRFGRVVAVAAIVTIDGQVVDVQEEKGVDLPEVWWDNPLVVDSPALTIRDGYLLDRSETPWAFINYDDAEFIR